MTLSLSSQQCDYAILASHLFVVKQFLLREISVYTMLLAGTV